MSNRSGRDPVPMQMDLVFPIGEQEQEKVRLACKRYIDIASVHFGYGFRQIPVRFDLTGKSAGMYCSQGNNCLIRYNAYIFARYFEDSIKTTVPHEVAHYIVDRIHGLRRVQAHGKEWRGVMQVFGADARCTHDYDLSGMPVKRQRRHHYRCACQDHQLSTTLHNRIQRARTNPYYCRHCGESLSYQG